MYDIKNRFPHYFYEGFLVQWLAHSAHMLAVRVRFPVCAFWKVSVLPISTNCFIVNLCVQADTSTRKQTHAGLSEITRFSVRQYSDHLWRGATTHTTLSADQLTQRGHHTFSLFLFVCSSSFLFCFDRHCFASDRPPAHPTHRNGGGVQSGLRVCVAFRGAGFDIWSPWPP